MSTAITHPYKEGSTTSDLSGVEREDLTENQEKKIFIYLIFDSMASMREHRYH